MFKDFSALSSLNPDTEKRCTMVYNTNKSEYAIKNNITSPSELRNIFSCCETSSLKCTYHNLQSLLTRHPRVVCGHLSQRLLQRPYQQNHRAQHGHYTKHQTTVEPERWHASNRDRSFAAGHFVPIRPIWPIRVESAVYWLKKSSPEVEGLGVDASAVRKQPVEHGGLPSHMKRRQHQPATRQPWLVADSMCQRRLWWFV